MVRCSMNDSKLGRHANNTIKFTLRNTIFFYFFFQMLSREVVFRTLLERFGLSPSGINRIFSIKLTS